MTPRARFVVVTLAASVACAVTARLGFWQLDRGAQKTALQAAIDARAALPPLVTIDGDPPTLHHRRVTLVGRWSAAHTVFLDNRQMDGRPGFFVVTPLVLGDGRAVVVQRGWVARDANERTRLSAIETPSAEVRLEGRIAPPPARLYDFAGGETGRIRQNLDLPAFARETGLRLAAQMSVLQTGAPTAADAPLRRDWPVAGSGVAKHHGYAFQWFGLSVLVAALYVWFQFIQPRRHRRA
jgi:surfeit locus 1 family protein